MSDHTVALFWYVPRLLLVFTLFRASRGNVLSKYPWFYMYVVAEIVSEVPLAVLNHVSPASYLLWYDRRDCLTTFLAWCMLLEVPRSVLPRQQRADSLTRFTWAMFYGVMFSYAVVSPAMAILAACVVVAEMFRYVLSPKEALEKFFRFLRVAIAGAILCGAAAYMELPPPGGKTSFLARLALQRDLHGAHIALMLAILAVLFYRRIPLDKALKGMFLGYAVYDATTLVAFSLRLHVGHPLFSGWSVLGAIALTISSIIWLISFWSYHPNRPGIALESEAAPRGMYEGIAAHALRLMARGGLTALRRARAWASLSPAKSPLS